MHRIGKLIGTLAIAGALVSCGGSSDSSPTSDPAVTEAPVTEAPVTEPPVTEAPVTEPPVTEAPATTVAAGPTVEIVEGTDFPAGATTSITVIGTGFTDLAVGARPPLAGLPTGLYVVYGWFDEEWRPSTGAPASTRRTKPENQMWAMPTASRAALDPDNLLPNIFVLEDDGSFEVTFDVEPIEGTGTLAVAVYPASGAINADHEFLIPVTFS
jgi:hypothetical protein